ncbi:MAG: hypothetical protein CMO30_18600 [Tistrella sp.]|jgi:predicted Fe-S protein YdhL (DUF1289 family)|uniref:DUF1289 domain-containing protein n=1 Tax=Tistrella mobilis TaxID=171437 RepID=A0A3B9IKY1_9PROT|nr:DUF1289 domain-containing protein [Tistrella sp.]MAD40095.1 hypothetical protein [Tistrella sp.]MAM76158.1 hypothetical protein [Tistrella sp.]MBA77282.1 hypothetical protein [Tistrella sp.]HAE48386.1 DUF1289 domain-containing protein [Tistrella mobilis]
MTVASPCVNVCRISTVTGWCEGCYRTIDEIRVWRRLDDDGKQTILEHVEDRRRDIRAGRVVPAGAAR